MHICPTLEANSLDEMIDKLRNYIGDCKVFSITITINHLELFIDA